MPRQHLKLKVAAMQTDRARRVAMVAQTYYPHDPRVRRAAEALHDAGYEVDVFCLPRRSSQQAMKEVVAGVRVYRLPIERRRGGKLRYLGEYGAFGIMAVGRVSAFELIRQ